MSPSPNTTPKRAYLRWAGTLLTLALLVYLFTRQGWGDILAAIAQISWWHLALALLLTLLSRLAVAGRWYFLLSIPEMEVSYKKTAQLTFAGLFASNFLPTTVGGDVVRLAGAVQLKLDGPISAASLVVDRLIGLLGMALAVPLGAAPLWNWLILDQGWNDAFQSSLAVAGLGGLWLRAKNLLNRLFGAFGLWKRQPAALLLSLAMTSLHMLFLYTTIALLLREMHDPIPFSLIAGLWSFVYLITLLPISINGYGVQEIAVTLIYTNVGGISLQSGLTIALLIRTLQMFASLPGAAFVPAIMAARDKNDLA